MADREDLTDEVIESIRQDVRGNMTKRFLGVFYAPDGMRYDISEKTPVNVLLDVIERLHADFEREQKTHCGTLSLLRLAGGRL